MSTASFCSKSYWPLPANVTYITALRSGAIEPLIGLISHCPILEPSSSFPPLPAFLAYFLTYLTSFLPC